MSNNVEYKYDLGSRLRDRVTGLTGIASGMHLYLNGCIQYTIDPPVKDNTMPDSRYLIDEAQLEFVDEGINDKPIVKTPTGGPSKRIPR